MASWLKVVLTLAATLGAWQVEGWAQSDGGLVASFSNLLIGVSVLLAAVSFVFVMLKVARLIDVLAERRDQAHRCPPRPPRSAATWPSPAPRCTGWPPAPCCWRSTRG